VKGPVYWHPALYALAMKRLYGTAGFRARYAVVAEQIPAGAEVVDLCAGDGHLRHFLKADCRYTAVDMNADFVARLKRAGVDAMTADLRSVIPTADVVVMMAALYHFSPDHHALVKRALGAARRRFILAEPVENVTASSVGFIRRLSAWASDPGDGTSDKRLGSAELEALLEAVPGGRVVHRAREWVLVWDRDPPAR
jgi:trans-aconitate methyltransferase